MFRQFTIFLLLSLLVVLFAKYIHVLIVYIDMFYAYVNLKLAPVFSQTNLATTMRKTLLLVFIPIAIAAIPALPYRLIKGKEMPYLIEVTWCLWIVIALCNLVI